MPSCVVRSRAVRPFLPPSGNPLGGSIPAELGALPSMEVMSCNSCGPSGSIPSSLGGLSKLTDLRPGARALHADPLPSVRFQNGGLGDTPRRGLEYDGPHCRSLRDPGHRERGRPQRHRDGAHRRGIPEGLCLGLDAPGDIHRQLRCRTDACQQHRRWARDGRRPRHPSGSGEWIRPRRGGCERLFPLMASPSGGSVHRCVEPQGLRRWRNRVSRGRCRAGEGALPGAGVP